MKKGWKIALISVGSLLGLVIVVVAVALWLVFTPSQLTKIVNNVAGNYVLAETHFDRVELTLFKTFPDAGLKIDNVYIVNPMEGAPSDTLARIGSLTLGVDVKSYLKEKKVIVHQVLLDDVDADLYINKEGRTNYDVFPSSGDTTKSTFSLDSLPLIDLRKIAVSDLGARLLDEKDGMDAGVEGLDLDVVGSIKEGLVDADVTIGAQAVALNRFTSLDSASTTLEVALQNLTLALKGEGNLDNVEGKLKLGVESGELVLGDKQMINEKLQNSKKDLLRMQVPFKADLQKMHIELAESELQFDDYTLGLEGQVQLKTTEEPMAVDMAVKTDGAWQVAPLLELLPQQYVAFKKDMKELDGKVQFAATAKGTVTDSTMPLIDAKVKLADGRFYMPKSLPYRINRINGDVAACLNLSNGGVSSAKINSLKAHTRHTDVIVKGRVDDLMGDMRVDADIKAKLPLEDAMPMVPDSLKLTVDGDANLDIKANFRMSDIKAKAFEKMKADADITLKSLDVVFDTIHAKSSDLHIKMHMPTTVMAGKMADATIASGELNVEMGKHVKAVLERANIAAVINNPMKEQIAAVFDVKVSEGEANIDSMMVSLEALALKGSVRLDSTQKNVIRQYNPNVDINLNGAVLYSPELPDAVRLSQLGVAYGPKGANLRKVEVKLGHSDFQLYGTVDNLEQWLDHKALLKADLNFTSNYTDVDQLLNLVSGIGSDKDTVEKMRQEDNVPKDANPFIVPLDVDVTLNTHIKRCIAFDNNLNDVAGAVTVKDGVAVLDQIGFVCKAATMQLTAMYKSPRPSHLNVSMDFHLLDIQIDELIDMIPSIDTLVPMLKDFNGNADFHLVASTYLNARYEPLMSSLKGAAAITGKNLTVMDNKSVAQIAKLMQFKTWKEKDNKLTIDSLDVELTALNGVIEVYPFLLNIGKYQICASGMHSLDNKCGYHVELLKNPLMAKVGVDIKGDIANPKITLGSVRYADYYKPEKQGVVEKQTLELKRQLKEALEAKVR
ncbi:MAG: AsmA family protein [Bacteroidales bacterium]|nr:AsmA family protein [Bacteroidales bacterium]